MRRASMRVTGISPALTLSGAAPRFQASNAAANASRGRAVFERTCASCHILFENGKHLGPELTGSNRGELDYVLNNVVDPNAIVGKDYQLTTIETHDGRTAAGIVQRETPSAITLVA